MRRGAITATYVGLALVFGATFAAVMPPTAVFDERVHFFRAYDLSEGRLVPTYRPSRETDSWPASMLPASVERVSSGFEYLINHRDRRLDREKFAEQWREPLGADGPRVRVAYQGTSCWCFVCYVPQAVGVRLARALGAGALAQLYAARVANLLCAITLVGLAIHRTPIFKRVMAASALTPLVSCLFGSVSADALTIALALLLTAVLLRMAVGSAPVGLRHLAPAFALGPVLGLCKLPYAAVALLYLAIPRTRVGSRVRYVTLGTALAAATVAPGLVVWADLARNYHAEAHTTPGRLCSRPGQVQYVLTHPFEFLQTAWASCVEQGAVWIRLARLPAFVGFNPLALQALGAFLVLLAVLDREEGIQPSARLRAVALLACAATTLGVLVCVYTWWTPVGAPRVDGIQGRYFLPILPLLLLPLADPAVRVRVEPRVLTAITGAVSVSTFLVAAAAGIQRYWVADSWAALSAPVTVGVGLLLTAAVWFTAVRVFDRPAAMADVGPAKRLDPVQKTLAA